MIKSGGTTAVMSNYDSFLSRLDNGGRANVERHITACQREPRGEHLKLWRRFAGHLAGLTPHVITVAGQRAVQFYEADGSFRRQLFALEDLRDGKIAVYAQDVLPEAIATGLLLNDAGEDRQRILFAVGSAPNEQLRIERLTASTTKSAPEYYRHMLDWNRKAIRITLPVDATIAQAEAAEAICSLAVVK